MDIKVLKNFDVSRAWFVNKNLVLSARNREDKKLGGFVCQELMLINPDSNEKADVEPQLDKYLTENVIYACGNRDYIVFPTLNTREDGTAVITWYLHKCYEGQSKQLHSVSVAFDELEKTLFIKVFVLDEFHMLIQTEKREAEESSFTCEMYNSESGVVSEVTIPGITESGIMCMTPLSEGICFLKFGRSFSPDKPFAYKPKDFNREYIGMVSVNKFISELSIDMDNNFVEVLEESKEQSTLPYAKAVDSLIIYAIYYPSEEKEDIIIYDSETGKKTVRINSRLNNINDLWHTFVIGGNPYLISASGGNSARITDLNTQKIVAKLNTGDDIPAVCGNYVILKRKKKKLLKETDYVEIYEFPKLMREADFSIKAGLEHCIVSGNTVILFVNDNKGEDDKS